MSHFKLFWHQIVNLHLIAIIFISLDIQYVLIFFVEYSMGKFQ